MWRTAVLALAIARVSRGVVSRQVYVTSEFDELYGIIRNGFKHHSQPQESNFVMWNGTQPGKHRTAVLCTMMKVGSSTIHALGFESMPVSAATSALLDSRRIRAVVVRNPIDRFLSWYNDKIINGSNPQVLAYNALLLRHKSHTRHPLLVYAKAIQRRPQGAWDLEYHLSPMSRMCHLGILQYDVVGDITDLPSFWKALLALNVSLPSNIETNSTIRVNSKPHAGIEDISCELYNTILDIYRHDMLWLQRLSGGWSTNTKLTGAMNCIPKR